MSFFKLNKEVSETTDDIDADDVLNTKNQLKNLGYYQTPDYGMTKISDRSMFDGIRNFQKDNKLTVDGVMKPQGETEGMFNKLRNNNKPQISPNSQSTMLQDMEFRRKSLLNGELNKAYTNLSTKKDTCVMNKANTAVATGINGYTLGAIDEITGGINATGRLLASPITKERPVDAIKKGYTEQRNL